MGRIVTCGDRYGYRQLMEDVRVLAETFPAVRVETIGYSVMGKPIPALTIGTGKLKVHYNAAMHANEWITAPLLLAFLEDIAESASAGAGSIICQRSGTELLSMAVLHAVPMVNPDGVDLVTEGIDPSHPYYDRLLRWNDGSMDFSGWKANIRGVDLNDQFPAGWQTELERRSPKRPGPRDYVGTAPLVEPEAQALAAYTEKHRFDLVMALHTQGREIYWNYRDCEPPEAERIARALAEPSGYRAVKLEDSDAGYKDWFIQQYRKPGFTVEAGCGTNPLPSGQFPALYQELLPILEKGLCILEELE